MPDLPTGVVTFLFTDIEGSTRLWEQKPEAMRDALARHDALLRDAIEQNHGRVFKTVGDAFYAVFAGPQDAVQAAVEAQRALHTHLPHVRVRMALHAGAAEPREGDYFGPDLNRVARLLAAGHGGQVLLSAAAVDQVRDALPTDTDVQLLGRHRLRDIAVRESVYQLSIPGLTASFPALDTLDVAFRRGILRASVVLLAVLAVVTGLAVAALTQARRAEQRGQTLRRHLYAAQMNFARQSWEEGNLGRVQELVEAWRPEAGTEDLRGWEWRYLWRLSREGARAVLRGHGDPVQQAAFSPDGKTLATTGTDQTVRLWDLASGREKATLTGHRGIVFGVAFSPDGRLLATGSSDRTVKLWDPSTRRELATLTGHRKEIGPVAFSPDGKTLASGSLDHTVRLWHVASRSTRIAFPIGLPLCLAFTPDGELLVVGDASDLRLCDPATGREVARLKGHSDYINWIAFSPDGKTLASASDDNTVKLWDLASRRVRSTLRGHRDRVIGLAFSPDGRLLGSGSWDQTVKLWDVATRREVNSLIGHTGPVLSVAFSPDGKALASTSWDRTVRIWDPTARENDVIVGSQGFAMGGVAFSPDGKTLAGGNSDGTVGLWNVSSHRRVATLLGLRDYVTPVLFATNGKQLVAADRDTLKVWDVGSRREIASFRRFRGGASSVAISADGRMLTFATDVRTVTVWEIASRRTIATFKLTGEAYPTVALSPDGKFLATGSMDGIVRLWDLASARRGASEHARPIASLTGHTDAIISIAFSPSGRILASGSWDKSVILWDVTTHRVKRVLRAYSGVGDRIAFSPDGQSLTVNSSNSVKLWNLVTGQEVMTLTGPRATVYDVAFSPDGNLVAASSADGTVRMWRATPFAETDAPANARFHRSFR